MSLSRNQLIDYLSKIDIEGKTVLDVGCGPKEKWAKNFVKGEPRRYVTLDIEIPRNSKINIAADLNIDFKKDIVYRHSFEEDGEFNSFDVVFCLEVLEHLWNPVVGIKNLYYMAKQGGICYISVPFINPIHDKWDYLRFTGEWFEKVLPKVGFSDVEVKRRKATEGEDLLYSFYKTEGLRMSKIRYKAGEGYKLKDIGYFIIAKK